MRYPDTVEWGKKTAFSNPLLGVSGLSLQAGHRRSFGGGESSSHRLLGHPFGHLDGHSRLLSYGQTPTFNLIESPVFGYRDETLVLVFDISHENKQ